MEVLMEVDGRQLYLNIPLTLYRNVSVKDVDDGPCYMSGTQ
jgi:hypothetical protein